MAALPSAKGGVSNPLSKAISNYKFGNWNHQVHGNTWRVSEGGTWYLPEKTLGWQILGWCSSYLRNEDGESWSFTLEQARFILWWYAVDDRGRFVYRTGVLQRLKGWLSGAKTRLPRLSLSSRCLARCGSPTGMPTAIPSAGSSGLLG